MFSNRRWRLFAYGILAVVLVVLCLFPQPYLARAKVVPGDGGLSNIFGAGQTVNLSSLLGGDRSTVEVNLQMARSEEVTSEVIRQLALVGPGRSYATELAAKRALGKKVDIHTLLGGIIEIETKSWDQDWALSVTKAYVDAVAHRLGDYVRNQVIRKRKLVENRLFSAQTRLSRAEAVLTEFRRANRLPDVGAQLGSQLMLRTNLESQIQAKQVELATLRSTSGPENPRLRAAEQQISALQRQLATAGSSRTTVSGPTVGGLTGISLQYANLYRDYAFAQATFEVYSRIAEETASQEIIAQDRMQVAVVDSAHVDSERYFNTIPVALLALLVLAALFVEVYAPATGLFLSLREIDPKPAS
ncbi:MAG: capsule biosynthesis protein [Novosphingobium sp.]|nr:capsule biosynthesis protein [Novosphingobium sp.]